MNCRPVFPIVVDRNELELSEDPRLDRHLLNLCVDFSRTGIEVLVRAEHNTVASEVGSGQFCQFLCCFDVEFLVEIHILEGKVNFWVLFQFINPEVDVTCVFLFRKFMDKGMILTDH